MAALCFVKYSIRSDDRMKDLRECIVYEDDHLIVCHKPPGIPVQSADVRVMDLECACLEYLHQTYIGIVQRLDQPVEGLLVLAKTKKAAGELSRQVQDGRMKKIYLAVVDGSVEPSEGMMQDHLVKDSRNRISRVVPQKTKDSREARLHYRVLDRQDGKSLLEIQLYTGRFHQIRVQLSSRGYPLIGDRKYHPQGNAQTGSLALCAYKLSLIHPVSRQEMCWEIQPRGSAFSALKTEDPQV